VNQGRTRLNSLEQRSHCIVPKHVGTLKRHATKLGFWGSLSTPQKLQCPKKLLEHCFDVLHNSPAFTSPHSLEFVTLELSMSQNLLRHLARCGTEHPFHYSLFTFFLYHQMRRPLLVSEYGRKSSRYATNPSELKSTWIGV
jgi:hypothetical protein